MTTPKSRIIDALGERSLLLPALVNQGLAANDRAKYFLTLLQMGQAHADCPEAAASDLRAERLAADVADAGFDAVVAASTRRAPGEYAIPRAREICAAIVQEIERMRAPLDLADPGAAAAMAARLARLQPMLHCSDEQRISGEQVAAITSGDARQGDSLHVVIMDLHKALNALQAGIAEEDIDGAACYGLNPEDRELVAAFMRGIARTRPLKFEHPGLGTTATHIGTKLVLQNDIGTTDAHVLVVHVEPPRVTLTYTDVHMQRLLFFQDLFERWRVDWEDTRSRTDQSMEDGVYHLSVGSYGAPTPEDLRAYLEFLGSRLVFLIDWNRARKRLRPLLPKKDVLALLKWAADEDHGHMAFLRADAAHAIFDALGFIAQGKVTLETRLDDLLGREAALDFMKFALRTCAEGALQGHSEALLHDEIRAELVSYFRSAQQSLLDLAAEHAALALEIASGIRDALLHSGEETAPEQFALAARRAGRWEHDADELVNRARGIVRQSERTGFYQNLIETADDVADELEEAAFHLTLLRQDGNTGRLLGALTELAGLLVAGTQEYLKALETARELRRGSPREDMQDFLAAVHRIVTSERRSDEAQRAVKTALLAGALDFRQFYAMAECARNLESAADGLMHSALMLRDYVLDSVASE
jgi:uncharacterized protein Yka (UPF0111/DUF47 family)